MNIKIVENVHTEIGKGSIFSICINEIDILEYFDTRDSCEAIAALQQEHYAQMRKTIEDLKSFDKTRQDIPF